MEMPNSEEYLKWIRSKVGSDVLIIVPNTEAYQTVLLKLGDSNIQLKK